VKILIYNVNWRGDVLFSTPAIHSIKKLYPDSHLTCLVTPRCREMLKGNPDVDQVLCFDERNDRALHLKFSLVRELRRNAFDVAFLFHRSFTRALILALAGIPKRIGYATKARGILLTHAVAPPAGTPHKVDYFLGLVRASGATETDRNYRFFVTPEDDARAGQFFVQGPFKHSIGVIKCLKGPANTWFAGKLGYDEFRRSGRHSS